MNDNRDDEFLSRIRSTLDASAESLDELTVARLKAARRRALDDAPRRRTWLVAGSFGVATLAAALVAVVVLTPAVNPAAGQLDQLEMLADADPDIYDNLEFYRWLAEQRRAS